MGISEQLLSYGTACTIICIIFSIYMRNPGVELHDRLVNVINGLIEVEEQRRMFTPKVAIGYGACVDLFVDGKDLLDHNLLNEEPSHVDNIENLNELIKSYAYYFKHGAAAERYVYNSTLFDSIVAAAEKLPNSRYVIGGNAPVMGIRMYREGCQVLLAASLTPKHLKSIPKGITVVGESINRDDIHLILEYKNGEKWGSLVAPRANRYILHNDEHNPRLKTLEFMTGPLKKMKPDLFVVSGLQLMDNFQFPKGFREERLRGIQNQLFISKSTKTHFEMASFTEVELLMQLRKYVIPHVDSLGMNEQELANLYSIYLYGNISVVTDSSPRVATVLDQMRFIFREIRKANQLIPNSRQLTRIHVHTLAFQVIMTQVDSSWKQTDVAAAKASLTAYRHVCASSEVDAERAAILMDESFSRSVRRERGRIKLEPEKPVPCWQESDSVICVAAGLVCTNAEQTAGGGDNISAAALAMQI